MVNETEALLVRQLVWDLSRENAAVAVEGKRDAAALTGLGFEGALMQFHRYGGFAKFADAAVRHPRIILLFDYDRKGCYMTFRLARLLQRRTVVDLTYRRRLSKITGGRVRFVEELLRYRKADLYAGVPT
ncbi:MAG: topoisomerase [Nitrosopumilaceae archaeon]|nr:topoisomerase [Nitrosopumilaceae archaeon]